MLSEAERAHELDEADIGIELPTVLPPSDPHSMAAGGLDLPPDERDEASLPVEADEPVGDTDEATPSDEADEPVGDTDEANPSDEADEPVGDTDEANPSDEATPEHEAEQEQEQEAYRQNGSEIV
jgi:hypothetical protein